MYRDTAADSAPIAGTDTVPTPAPGVGGLDLARQQRNLLLMRPLYELAMKSRREAGEAVWNGLDTNYLALALLVFIMDGQALGQGRTFEECLDHSSELARRMNAALSPEQARDVAREVLEALANSENKSQPFTYDYYDGSARRTRTQTFVLLRYERSDVDDIYYYRASDEGFVVYLGMLDFGAADMQVLMEKMLHEFIRRGNVDQALDVSQRALLSGRRYHEQIESQLMRAHRVPDKVRWSEDLAPRLAAARKHIDERLHEEHQLLQAAETSLASTTEAQARDKFVRLRDSVRASLGTSTRLLQILAAAGERFRAAARKLFRMRRRHRLPNLEEVVFPDLLQMQAPALGALGEEYAGLLFGPQQPRLFDYDQLFATLLAPRPDSGPDAADEGELIALMQEQPHFAMEDEQAAQEFLREYLATHPGCDVVQVLQAAQNRGLSRIVQQYMTFVLYRAFSREESPYPVNATAADHFEIGWLAGTNLIFTPDAAPSTSSAPAVQEH